MRVLTALLLTLSLSAPALAQVRPMGLEVSPYAGIWEGDSVFETGATFGGRLRYDMSRLFGLELNYGVVATEQLEREQAAVEASESTTLGLFGANGVLHLAYGAFTPFMTAGVGFVSADEASFAANAGAGATYRFTDLVGARVEGRGWFSGDAPATDRFHHFEVTFGLTLQFMGKSDLDGDGISGSADLCPTQPEDVDTFEDTDGCPDDDNDDDGVKDADDKCPLKAEDKDDDADEDGCPEDDAPAAKEEPKEEPKAEAKEEAKAEGEEAKAEGEEAKAEGEETKAEGEETKAEGEEAEGEEKEEATEDADATEDTEEPAAEEAPEAEPAGDSGDDGEDDGEDDAEGDDEGEADSRLWFPRQDGLRFT